MNKDGIFEIALFPIPGSVSFPQTIVPLHVFEPRYRQMVQDCVREKRLLGVCHTKSIERFATRQKNQVKTREELFQLYKQNLTTYSPEDVFSAGPVSIVEETVDGRYLIHVHMLKRYRIININQSTPYKVAHCQEYLDFDQVDFESLTPKLTQQKTYIIDFLRAQLAQLTTQTELFTAKKQLADLIEEQSVNDFTFKLFRFFRMPENSMQEILNLQNPIERLNQLYDFIQKFKNGVEQNY